ncbi:MAG: DNA double-strand break repair nuclease NurA [Candidatus Sericytochromatia bacterium]
MLDFTKLSNKISEISIEISEEVDRKSKKLEKAFITYEKAVENDIKLGEKVTKYFDVFPWMVGRPLEQLKNIVPLPKLDLTKFTVVSTDGSQITPSHHEISMCYLINIGLIMFTYGTGEKPIQESEPFIYDSDKSLYQTSKKAPSSFSEDVIAIQRMLKEIEELKNLCKKAKDRGHPVIALSDGTLINWNINNQLWSEEYKNMIMDKFLSSLDEIKEMKVPVCGYISNSRRNDFVNYLRVQLCPYDEVDCEKLCYEKEVCDSIIPLYDREIWLKKLKEGERSPIFASSAKILDKYKEHQICFFYLNVGKEEIARLEIPRWVADNEDSLNLVHYIVYDQVQKGRGYPITIQEAHNQAVVKNADRMQFYSILSRKMINNNIKVALSNKEIKKRGGLA